MSALADRLNTNKHIRYPFIDDAWMLDSTGAYELPDDFLVDFSAVSYGVGTLQSTLDSIEAAGDGSSVTVTFKVNDITVQNVNVPVAFDDYYSATALTGGAFDVRHTATFSDGLKRFAAEHAGETFEFYGWPSLPSPYLGIPLHWSCVIKRAAHRVLSIQGDDPESSWEQALTGDVRFMEGWNTRITVLEADNMLRIAPIAGEGKGMPCEPVLYPSGSPYDCNGLIYHINGLHCNWLGEFQLSGGKGITVAADPANHKIVLKTNVDRCQPGCTKDLEA